MKTMFITGKETDTARCAEYLKSVGSENIFYHWPVKAMDNLDEICPHVLVLNANDFPRLWKTILQYVRSDEKFEDLIVLLIGSSLDDAEQDKARCLGVSRIIQPELNESDEKVIYNLLAQNHLVSEKEAVSLAFRHPATYGIVTGQITGMYGSIVIFKPEKAGIIADIKNGTVIKSSTLKIGHAVTEPLLKVLHNGTSELQLQIL